MHDVVRVGVAVEQAPRQRGVDQMLLRLYEPILWRALQAAPSSAGPSTAARRTKWRAKVELAAAGTVTAAVAPQRAAIALWNGLPPNRALGWLRLRGHVEANDGRTGYLEADACKYDERERALSTSAFGDSDFTSIVAAAASSRFAADESAGGWLSPSQPVQPSSVHVSSALVRFFLTIESAGRYAEAARPSVLGSC